MRLDSQLSFVPYGSPLSLVGGAGVAIPSNVIDLLGAGVGQPSPNIIGNVSVFGADIGVGGIRPEIMAAIGVTCTTANSATLNLALQYAADNGSNQPGTWETAEETGAIPVATLVAGLVFARFPFVPTLTANKRPRFTRLLAQVPSGTNFSAGTLGFALVTLIRDDLNQKNAARNFVVA